MSVRKPAPVAGKKVDARVERTRKALQRAFVALFFERPYERISVNAIAERAGVGRSTFYEHYIDKEDVLAATVHVPMSGLAAAVSGGSPESLMSSLTHFRANAAQARSLFLGTARKPLGRVLAKMIEERLTKPQGSGGPSHSQLTKPQGSGGPSHSQLTKPQGSGGPSHSQLTKPQGSGGPSHSQLNGDERSLKIVAIALAEAQIGAIAAWLFGEVTPTVEELAAILHRLARAVALSMADSKGARDR